MSVSIALGFGVPIGLSPAISAGLSMRCLSRVTDALLACPVSDSCHCARRFLLGPSLTNAMIAIGITTTPIFVRLTRGQVMAVKVEDYVEAARAVGNPRWRIAFGTSCRISCPPCWCRRRSRSPPRSLPKRDCRSSDWVSSRRAPSWGSMLNSAQRFLVARRGWRFGRGLRFSSRCCPSIWSATVCAMRSIRESAEGPTDATPQASSKERGTVLSRARPRCEDDAAAVRRPGRMNVAGDALGLLDRLKVGTVRAHDINPRVRFFDLRRYSDPSPVRGSRTVAHSFRGP